MQKKLSEELFECLGKANNLIPRLITFLVAFYEVLLSVDVKKLDAFICNYQNDSIEAISVFESGLKKDSLGIIK